MSSTLTKNIVLSQHKVGSFPEATATRSLVSETKQGETHTTIKIEIPGVDPSTVDVSCEGTTVSVRCDRGSFTHPVDISTDTSKITADIQWGMLTLSIPNPPAPVAKTIKVSVHDSVKSTSSRSNSKFTSEE